MIKYISLVTNVLTIYLHVRSVYFLFKLRVKIQRKSEYLTLQVHLQWRPLDFLLAFPKVVS